ncbi:MAG: hypothetical protein GTO45_35245 [Candidatus Aminicenantes bacterium]|nr:hypothetical protein [Candidatus Aminicenantes bacterium]NIO86655.1 hypothetical protein [Candidatus Aminicenantes bacterium]NIT28533.1 hypothetical protein [Candidatus Aminicenantes bacterium]
MKLKDTFLENERARLQEFVNYRQLGTYGFRLVFFPSPFSILAIKSGILPGITSYVDAGERLKIYNPLKGRNLFQLRKHLFTDFSGFIFFFGSLLALFYGYESYYKENYLKFLASVSTGKVTFFSILVSRILVLLVLVLIFPVCSLLLIAINGLPLLVDIHSLYFILVLFLLCLFFFILGSVFSYVKSKIVGISLIAVSWFLLVFAVPAAIDSYISGKSELIKPVYVQEMEKLEIVMDFEKLTIDKLGTLETGKEVTEADRAYMANYIENQLKKIRELEQELLTQMQSVISHYQWLSSIFPTTFFQSSINELSSKGYDNLIDHYKYVLDLKHRFVTYIFERVYFSNFSRVEPFVKNEENVFYAKSRVPGNFLWGVLVNLFIILLLTWVSYTRYKKHLYREPEKQLPPREPPVKGKEYLPAMEVNKDWYTPVHVRNEGFKNRVYNILSGRKTPTTIKNFQDRLYIDYIDIVELEKPMDFLYLCSPDQVPGDIKVKNFILYLSRLSGLSAKDRDSLLSHARLAPLLGKRFYQLEYYEKSEIFLVLTDLKNCEFYLIDNIGLNMSSGYMVRFSDKMDELNKRGAYVLYLTTQPTPESYSDESHEGYWPPIRWHEVIDLYRKK